MRVLYLALDVSLGDLSGDAIHVRESTRALANLGAEIHLVVPVKDGRAERELVANGVFVHSIPPSGDLRTALVCKQIAQRIRPDVIFERRFSPKIGVAVSRACGLPLVLEINGLPEVEMKILHRSNTESGIVAALKFKMRKWLFSRVDRVVVVTPGLAEAIAAQYGIPRQRIVVVSNGADVDAFRPGDPKEAKESLGIPPNRPNVGFVGTLYPWHGLRHLIAAAPKVVRERPDVLFSIVGDGPERQSLEAEAKRAGLWDNFLFAGWRDHSEVPAYIQSFDICVLPVATELFSVRYGSSALKLYEYLACGRPIIAARYPGFEMVEQAGCGILIDPSNALEFSSALLTLIADSTVRATMGLRAREIAVERYSWSSVAQHLVGVLDELSERGPRGRKAG